MKNWVGKSLKHKLSLLIIVTTLVPLLFLGLFSYTTAEGLAEEKAKSAGMNTLRQVEVYLSTMVKDVENMSLFLIGHNGVQNYLKSPESDLIQQTTIINFLTNLAFSKDYIANIIVEPLGSKPPISHKSITGSDFMDIAAAVPDYYELHPKWWSDVHRQWTFEGARKVITLARPIRSTDKYKLIGKVQINLDQAVIARQIRQAALEKGGFVMLLDEKDRIIAGPDNLETNLPLSVYYPDIGPFNGESGFLDYGSGADKKTVLYKTMSSANWKLVGIIPTEAYRSQNHYFLVLTAVAVSVAMLFVIIFVVFLIQKITKPLSALTSFLKNASPDEPLPAIPVKSIDEVGQLIVSYNRLSSRIVKLTDEVKHNESLKKEADMQALQLQINPHFLYNTLSSIQWLALMNRDDKIAGMVGSLSDFLRFSLNNGQEYCHVGQEMMHVQNYVSIQSIRYPEKFRFHVQMDAEAQDQLMLKLLLQPLVENAMLHGILKREGPGEIAVTIACSGQGMHFSVADNGIGIPDERLEWLRQQLTDAPEKNPQPAGKGGYGLRNVHSRLVLHYGREAGLQIESAEGQGTKISFRIPFTGVAAGSIPAKADESA